MIVRAVSVKKGIAIYSDLDLCHAEALDTGVDPMAPPAAIAEPECAQLPSSRYVSCACHILIADLMQLSKIS